MHGKLSKSIVFSPKELRQDQDQTTPAYHSTLDFKRSILQCLFPYFLQIKCSKSLQWRPWIHNQFSRHFPSSCSPHSLAPAPATYSQRPPRSSRCTHSARFGAGWWARPTLNPLSLPWSFAFSSGGLPVCWSCAGCTGTREQIRAWQRLQHHTPLPREILLNPHKQSPPLPRQSKNKHTLHYKTGKGTRFRQ